MTMTQALNIVAAAVVLIAARTDLRTRLIPNALTLGSMALGLGVHALWPAVADGWSAAGHGLVQSLAGAAICGLPPLLLFARGEMGGGDVKLFAAIGALCGSHVGLAVLGCTQALVLLVYIPFSLVRAGRSQPTATARTLRTIFRSIPPVALAPWAAVAFLVVQGSTLLLPSLGASQ